MLNAETDVLISHLEVNRIHTLDVANSNCVSILEMQGNSGTNLHWVGWEIIFSQWNF